MSKCVKCDRCGRVVDASYDGDASATIFMRNNESGMMEKTPYDLCVVCAVKLYGWLRGKE